MALGRRDCIRAADGNSESLGLKPQAWRPLPFARIQAYNALIQSPICLLYPTISVTSKMT
jgi:hypothetical protein